MERYCSTGQSPQRDVAPTEEEQESRALNLCLHRVGSTIISLNLNIGLEGQVPQIAKIKKFIFLS